MNANLASFKYCKNTLPVSKITLSKNHLCYLRKEQLIQCTVCHLQIQPEDISASVLTCPHNGIHPVSTNTPTGMGVDLELNNPYLVSNPSSTLHIPVALESSAPFPTSSSYACYHKQGTKRPRLTLEEVQMDVLANRIATFQEDWPVLCPVSAMDLAEAGFYYIGPGDRVKCAYCKKRIKNWEPSDDAMSEHQRLSPFCSFATMN